MQRLRCCAQYVFIMFSPQLCMEHRAQLAVWKKKVKWSCPVRLVHRTQEMSLFSSVVVLLRSRTLAIADESRQ